MDCNLDLIRLRGNMVPELAALNMHTGALVLYAWPVDEPLSGGSEEMRERIKKPPVDGPRAVRPTGYCSNSIVCCAYEG